MSIEQLTDIEQKFSHHLQIIRQQAKQLPKAQKLRIVAWLKKLCSVVDNRFWRKNRNLYTQVLAIMLQSKMIEPPFDKSPPQTSLPKLNIYQIPFWIRERLDESNNIYKISKNENQDLENLPTNECLKMRHVESAMSDMANFRLKKKQSHNFKSLQGTQIPQSLDMFHINSQFNNEEQLSQQQTKRKNQNIRKHQTNKAKTINSIIPKDIVQIMEKTLYFLAKNNKNFQNSQQYRKLIEQIVQYGDQLGLNFRQMKFSIICE